MKKRPKSSVYVQLRAPGEDGRLVHCKGLTLTVNGFTPEQVFTVVRQALHVAAWGERARRHRVPVPETEVSG